MAVMQMRIRIKEDHLDPDPGDMKLPFNILKRSFIGIYKDRISGIRENQYPVDPL